MSDTEMSSTDHTATNYRTSEGLSWWQAIAAGAVTAAVVNLVIFFIGAAAGASFAVLDRGTPQEISAWTVLNASVLPLVVGTGLAALLAHWWLWVIRLAQVIGGGLGLLSVAGPLMADADGATRVALALMHVVLAVAVVVSLEAIRRRTKASRQL